MDAAPYKGRHHLIKWALKKPFWLPYSKLVFISNLTNSSILLVQFQ